MSSDPLPGSEHTSERIDPAYYLSSAGDAFLYACHLATYDFAAQHTEGRRVLDFGCGTGYGTSRIAGSCASIVGVDVSGEAIDEAVRRFSGPGRSFERIRPAEDAPLPFEDDSFDVVLSFQVYEHLPDTEAYLRQVRRVLRPDGLFICVTPDRSSRLFPRQRPWNRFHLHEYSQAELAAELTAHFAEVEVAGMSAEDDLISLETRRYRKLRTITYPVTFPGVPEAIRLPALRMLQRMERGRKAIDTTRAASSATLESFGVSPADVKVFTTDSPSLNVVALARRPR